MNINKDKIKRFFISFLWCTLAAGCITLLASAVLSKDRKRCKGLEIEISGVSNYFFIDRADVYNIIKDHGGDTTGKRTLASIDLKRIEKELENDVWIKNAELFFDNNDILKVAVEEREPVARVFTLGGNTFYIDSSCKILPLSEKFSARLPLFTGFVSEARVLSHPDSVLLNDIKNISLKITADSFLTALIEQVDIMQDRSFEMTPKIGKQVILFGDANDADAKFERLRLFYKNVMAKTGWNRYRAINLKYRNQVVGVITGREDIVADSLKTLSIMKSIAEDAARRASDSALNFVQDADINSADSTMINVSIQRDEPGVSTNALPQLLQPAQNTPVSAPVPTPKITLPPKASPSNVSVAPPKPKPKSKAKPKPKPKQAIQRTENEY